MTPYTQTCPVLPLFLNFRPLTSTETDTVNNLLKAGEHIFPKALRLEDPTFEVNIRTTLLFAEGHTPTGCTIIIM